MIQVKCWLMLAKAKPSKQSESKSESIWVVLWDSSPHHNDISSPSTADEEKRHFEHSALSRDTIAKTFLAFQSELRTLGFDKKKCVANDGKRVQNDSAQWIESNQMTSAEMSVEKKPQSHFTHHHYNAQCWGDFFPARRLTKCQSIKKQTATQRFVIDRVLLGSGRAVG